MSFLIKVVVIGEIKNIIVEIGVIKKVVLIFVWFCSFVKNVGSNIVILIKNKLFNIIMIDVLINIWFWNNFKFIIGLWIFCFIKINRIREIVLIV